LRVLRHRRLPESALERTFTTNRLYASCRN